MTRLLIAYDDSPPAQAAITAAGTLFTDAEAIVAHVHTPPPLPGSGALARAALPESVIREGLAHMRAEIEVHANATIAAGMQHAAGAGLHAESRLAPSVTAWRALRELGQETNADAIVCGTRGNGPMGRIVLGSTASSLLYHADRPLLVVPAELSDLGGPVLVGWDDSDGARGALGFVAAHLSGRPVLVAHVWHSPVRHSVRGQLLAGSGAGVLERYAKDVDTIWGEVAAEMAERGAAYAREHGLEATALAPESGHSDWQALLHVADNHNAAAIVVGSRGRGAVVSTILGSVASGLVHAAELPTLVT